MEKTMMTSSSFLLDIIVTAICAAFFVALWNVIAHVRASYKAKPSKGNPFKRQFKDYELQAILKRQL